MTKGSRLKGLKLSQTCSGNDPGYSDPHVAKNCMIFY